MLTILNPFLFISDRFVLLRYNCLLQYPIVDAWNLGDVGSVSCPVYSLFLF